MQRGRPPVAATQSDRGPRLLALACIVACVGCWASFLALVQWGLACRAHKPQPPPCGLGSAAAAAAITTAQQASPAVPLRRNSLGLEEISQLILQSAQRFGTQRKAGKPANLRALLEHLTDTTPNLHGLPAKPYSPDVLQWLAATTRLIHAAPSGSPVLPSPIPACHFYIDHTYRFIYIKLTKTGSASLRGTLGAKDTPPMCSSKPDKCYVGCKGKPVCMEYTSSLEELAKSWRNYTVFTFVRNPWTRAVSSWQFISDVLRPECRIPFADFAAAPTAYAAVCAADPICCLVKFGWVLTHMEAQTPCLVTDKGQPAVDFIGRMEQSEEDFPELISLLNSRRPPGTKPLRIDKFQHINRTAKNVSSDEKLRTYAELFEDNAALEGIYRYYRRDFEWLQHAPYIDSQPVSGRSSRKYAV